MFTLKKSDAFPGSQSHSEIFEKLSQFSFKDLKVKGANFIAKRGTAVRRISLVQDNANHIQGKIQLILTFLFIKLYISFCSS